MKSLLIKAPKDASFELLSQTWKDLIYSLAGQWFVSGRVWLGHKMLDCLVFDSFIVPGEVDAEGNPLTPTPLPAGWSLLMAWKYNAPEDMVSNSAGTATTIAAVDITDDTIQQDHWYSKLYVRPILDLTDPQNPVVTGVDTLDRLGTVKETHPGVLPDAQGGVTLTTPVAVKVVPGVGNVMPEQLNPDGSYTHIPIDQTIVKSALTPLMTQSAEIIEYCPDEVTYDANGDPISSTRPTSISGLMQWSGWPSRF